MRPLFLALLAPILLSACSARDESAVTARAAVGEQVACIDLTRVAGRRAESNRTLVFELTDRTYRNELAEACPGIERASNFGTLAVDAPETQICRGDMVRVYDPADLRGSSIKTAPRCRLGAFTRIR